VQIWIQLESVEVILMDMTKGIPVRVQLETWVTQDGQAEHHQFDEAGQMVQIGDTIYVRYTEPTGDKLPVTIKIKGDNQVGLTRGSSDGTTHMHMDFMAEKEIQAQYRTPYGIIPVSTVTPRLDVLFTTEPLSGQVYLEYRLKANGEHLGDYRMRLLFTA
jgi:uncharacterized beta-barrel protein YwiB (DUF1934 family)